MLLVAGVIIVVIALTAVYFFWPSPSLGVYTGALVNLFPKSMGQYEFSSSIAEDSVKYQTGASDARLAFYQKRDQKTTSLFDFTQPVEAQAPSRRTVILALNFSTIERAEEGLQKLRSALADASIIQSGVKKKGLFAVGDRFILVPHKNLVRNNNPTPADGGEFVRAQNALVLTPDNKVVTWTNGSVLFVVQDSDDQALEIEGLFPY